jgi:hypothetical protein
VSFGAVDKGGVIVPMIERACAWFPIVHTTCIDGGLVKGINLLTALCSKTNVRRGRLLAVLGQLKRALAANTKSQIVNGSTLFGAVFSDYFEAGGL